MLASQNVARWGRLAIIFVLFADVVADGVAESSVCADKSEDVVASLGREIQQFGAALVDLGVVVDDDLLAASHLVGRCGRCCDFREGDPDADAGARSSWVLLCRNVFGRC